jgi:hypothetical protein
MIYWYVCFISEYYVLFMPRKCISTLIWCYLVFGKILYLCSIKTIMTVGTGAGAASCCWPRLNKMMRLHLATLVFRCLQYWNTGTDNELTIRWWTRHFCHTVAGCPSQQHRASCIVRWSQRSCLHIYFISLISSKTCKLTDIRTGRACRDFRNLSSTTTSAA